MRTVRWFHHFPFIVYFWPFLVKFNCFYYILILPTLRTLNTFITGVVSTSTWPSFIYYLFEFRVGKYVNKLWFKRFGNKLCKVQLNELRNVTSASLYEIRRLPTRSSNICYPIIYCVQITRTWMKLHYSVNLILSNSHFPLNIVT